MVSEAEPPEVLAGAGGGGRSRRRSGTTRQGVLLVRHGQSTWNADGRWQGQADPPLSALGEEQARAAGGSGELAGVVAVWSSDLQRAGHTAALLAPAGCAVELDARLRERRAGAWEGLTRDEIELGWPGFLSRRDRPDGWESDEAVLGRALDAIGEIAGSAAGPVVLVTHGGVIRAVERRFGGEELAVPNLGGRWLEVDGGAMQLAARVLLVDVSAVTIPGQI